MGLDKSESPPSAAKAGGVANVITNITAPATIAK
jgi:hypothetical protein